MKLLWITPEESGGIRSYTNGLWPALRAELSRRHPGATLDATSFTLAARDVVHARVREIRARMPDRIHIQHEYGLFGSKRPGQYSFPWLLSELRRTVPRAVISATAHTVLPENFRYGLKGHGIRAPLRWLANQTYVNAMRAVWTNGTWGELDGVVVHSESQAPLIRKAGCEKVAVIPHYVAPAPLCPSDPSSKTIAVFGYISPEKGQDVLIQAFAKLREKHPELKLLIAGGLRRPQDGHYERYCRRLVARAKLESQVEFTGFVKTEEIDAIYARARLVVAPFRETSGSGSLTQGLARGAPMLASDLPLNREVAEREKGALAFFRAGDADDCASQIECLIGDEAALRGLREAGRRYAEKLSVEAIARQYADFLAK